MGLDIRLPLGLMFFIIGGMLSLYGIATRGSGIYARSLGIDVNLAWGVPMLLFGLAMASLAWRSRARGSD